MYFLFWLSLAAYFGFLSAMNVRFAARLPSVIFRWLAIVIHGMLLLSLLGYFGIYVYVADYGASNRFLASFSENVEQAPISEGLFFPYLLLAGTIVSTFIFLSIFGFRKCDAKPHAATWPSMPILLASLASLFGAGMVYRTLDRIATADLFRHDAAAVQQLQQIYGPDISEEKNAWATYTVIGDLDSLQPFPPFYQAWNYQNPQTFPAEDPSLLPFMEKIQPTIIKLRAASEIPHLQSPNRIMPVGSLECITFEPTISDSFVWRKLLCFDAYFQATQNHSHEATQNILAMQRIANQAAQHQDKHSLAHSLDGEKSAAIAIESLLGKHLFSRSELIQLSNGFSKNKMKRLATALEVDRLNTRRDYITWYTDSICDGFDPGDVMCDVGRVFFAQHNLAVVNRESNHRSKTLQQDSWNVQQSAIQREFVTPAAYTGYFCESNSCYGHPIVGFIVDTVLCEARIRLTQAGIAAYLFALQEGRFPKTLAELHTFDPTLNLTDPCSGKPLKMIHHAEKLFLYSVGENQRDDQPFPNEYPTRHDDIFFTIHLPPVFLDASTSLPTPPSSPLN